MRKMMNKKGFSLVELMIVVVIMGILIAVAIPLYGAITENAEKKTCLANQTVIHEMFAKYCLMEDGKTSFTLLPNGEYNTKEKNADDIDDDFFQFFEDGELPGCSLEGHYFVIKPNGNQDYSIKIECYDAEGNLESTHIK